MPLAVIGAGYPRTATMSLKLALEQLGFGPCHHMVEVGQHPQQAKLWARAFAEEPVDWEEVFSGYRSTTDSPSCFFFKLLADRYPSAKVILTVRSPESWWRSAQATVFSNAIRESFMNAPGADLIIPMADEMRNYHVRHRTGLFPAGDIPPGDERNREPAIASFLRHNEEVRCTIAPERLLVFEPKDGWAPLCKFLDVPVPNTPFPRENTTEAFQNALRPQG